MNSRVLRVPVSLSLVALVGCHWGGGDPIDEDPHALTVGGSLPLGVAAGSVRAEGEGWGDDPFVVLANGVPAGGGAFSLTLPSEPPPEVLWDADDLDALLCAGLDLSGVTTSRSPLQVALVDRLWRWGTDTLFPLTAASRSGIGFELPSAFDVGDVIHRFVYVARSLSVAGSCSFGGGAVVHDLDLALRPGWNAFRTDITAVAGGHVQAFETTVAQDADGLDWFAGEPRLAGVRLRHLPPSRWHASASRWGYHQSKLVRDGATPTMAKVAPASNIRFGTTVLPDGECLAVWTETVGAQPYVRLRREVLGAAVSEWLEVATLPVDAIFQYPYVVSDGERALVAAVENEHEEDGLGNRYQQVLLWRVGVGSSVVPDEDEFVDYRSDPLAAS